MPYWFVCILVIVLSLALLVHFTLIAIYGAVTIQEANPVYLILEMLGLVFIIGLAIWSLIKRGGYTRG